MAETASNSDTSLITGISHASHSAAFAFSGVIAVNSPVTAIAAANNIAVNFFFIMFSFLFIFTPDRSHFVMRLSFLL